MLNRLSLFIILISFGTDSELFIGINDIYNLPDLENSEKLGLCDENIDYEEVDRYQDDFDDFMTKDKNIVLETVQAEVVHKKIKKHICLVEGCRFASFFKRSLNYHTKFIHDKTVCDKIKNRDKIINYVCPVEGCGYEAFKKNDLTMHVKIIHDKIKDHICHVAGCKYKTARKGDLTKHIRIVHNKIKDYPCPIYGCRHASSTKQKLNKHLKGVHKLFLKLTDKNTKENVQ